MHNPQNETVVLTALYNLVRDRTLCYNQGMRKTGLRRSSPRRVLLLGLSLVIPGLLISMIGIGSVARQQQTRAIQLREQWQGRLQGIALNLEKTLDGSIESVFASLAKGPLDAGRPLQIQQRLKNLLSAHPIIAFPFMITAAREYIFPFTRPMLSLPDRFDVSLFSSMDLKREFQAGEDLEFKERRWLAAIKKYLAGAERASTVSENAVFSQAIGRCYFKWGKYPQGRQYFLDVVRNREPFTADGSYLHLQARQLLALTYDRLGSAEAAADCYLELYEDILALQAASQSLLLDFYKNEALDYLNRQISRSASLQERLDRALRRESLQGVPTQELSLRWKYFRFPELEQEVEAGVRQGIEFKRLQQLQEFYLLNDEKKLFYNRLKKELPLPSSEPAPVVASGFIRQAALRVAYARLPLVKTGDFPVFFGFRIALAHIQQELFPALKKEYWPETGPELVLTTRAEAAALAADKLPQLELERFLPGYLLAVKAPRHGYLEARIRRELLVNYALIAALLFTLVVAVALFIRSLHRDMELLELKNRFLDSAAHTLKTPLARIRMLAEQLQLNWMKNEEQRATQSGRIIAAVDRMNDVIGNLLDLSRIEAGQKTYRLQPASLPEIAAQAWAEALPLLKENGFACRAEIDENIPAFALDARALRLVIGNLVQNAFSYSPDHKEVVLKVYRSAADALLEMVDRGRGIAPEHHVAIFEKFFRVESDETGSGQGSGLGLFLVKHAVDAHGGRIEVQSLPGQGARFIIRLPMNAGQPQRRQGKSS